MGLFTREALRENNNTLLMVTVIIILLGAIYTLVTQDNFKGILISWILLLVCALIVVGYMD